MRTVTRPENTVLKQMQERLTEASKRKVSAYAQRASRENLLQRRDAQVTDLQSIRKQNEYLSAMGLGSSIGYDPSSGADVKARRMTSLNTLNQTLKITERQRAAAMKAADDAAAAAAAIRSRGASNGYIGVDGKWYPGEATPGYFGSDGKWVAYGIPPWIQQPEQQSTPDVQPAAQPAPSAADTRKAITDYENQQKSAMASIVLSSGYRTALDKNAYMQEQLRKQGLESALPASTMQGVVVPSGTARLQKTRPVTVQQVYDSIVASQGAAAGQQYLLSGKGDFKNPFKYGSNGEYSAVYKAADRAIARYSAGQIQKAELLSMPAEHFQAVYDKEAAALADMEERRRAHFAEKERDRRRTFGEATNENPWTSADEGAYNKQKKKVKELTTMQTQRRAQVFNAAVEEARKVPKEDRDRELATFVTEGKLLGNTVTTGRLGELEHKRTAARYGYETWTAADETEYKLLTERKDILLAARDADIADQRAADHAKMFADLQAQEGYSDAVAAAREVQFTGKKSGDGKGAVYLGLYNGTVANLILGNDATGEQQAVELYKGAKGKYSAGDMLPADVAVALMTDEEKDAFLYYAAQGDKQATEYLESIQTYLNERDAKKLASAVQSYADSAPVLAAITARFTAFMSSWGFIYGTLQRISGENVDAYAPAFAYTAMTETADSTVSKKMQESMDDETFGKVLAFGYQTLMSVADSTITAYTGGGSKLGQALSLALMSTRAATSTWRDVLMSGGTQKQGTAMAFLSGTFEALFEKLSIDKLWSAKSIDRLIKRVLLQAGTEASEELATEVANIVADIAVMGSRSEIQTSIRRYMSQGYTRAEAESFACRDALQQIGMAAAGGFLSGGMMAGGFGLIQDTQTRKMGAEIGVEAATEQAKAYQTDPDVQRFLQRLSEAVKGGKRNTVNFRTGQLVMATANAAVDMDSVNRSLKQMVRDGSITKKEAAEYRRAMEEYLAAWENDAELSARTQNVMNEIPLVIMQQLMPGATFERGEATTFRSLDDIAESVNGRQVTDDARTDRHAAAFRYEVNAGGRLGYDAATPNASAVASMMRQNGRVPTPADPVQRAKLESEGYTQVPGTNYMQAPESKPMTRAEAEAAIAERKPKRSYVNKDGVRVTLYEVESLKDVPSWQKAYIKLAGVLKRVCGINVELHDTLAFAGSDGYFDRASNTVHLSLDSMSYGGTIAHELTHFIEMWSPEGWNAIRDFCKEEANKRDAHGWESLLAKREEQYGAENAESEAVASMMEGVLADETAVREFCQKNETVGRKILEWLGDLLDQLKAVFANDQNDASSKWITDTGKAFDLWANALDKASRAAEGRQSDVQTARTDAKTEAQIRDAVDQFCIDIRPSMPRGARVGEHARSILDSLYESVKNADALAFDGLTGRLFDALSMDNDVAWTGSDEAGTAEIRKRISGAKFSITDTLGKQEVDSAKRKDGEYFGRLTFVKNGGQSIMGFYEDLVADYPGVFQEARASDEAAEMLNDFMKDSGKHTGSMRDYMQSNPEAAYNLTSAIKELSYELVKRLDDISRKSGKQMRMRKGDLFEIERAVRARSLDDISEEVYNQCSTPALYASVISSIRIMLKFGGFRATVYAHHNMQSVVCEFDSSGHACIYMFEDALLDHKAESETSDDYRTAEPLVTGVENVGPSVGGSEGHVLGGYPEEAGGQVHRGGENAAGGRRGYGVEDDNPRTISRTRDDQSHSTGKEAPNNGASFDVQNQHRLRPSLQAGKERLAAMTPDDAKAFASLLKPVAGRAFLDPIRFMDRAAATPEVRHTMYELLEKPFNEAGGEYGRELQQRSGEYLAKMKELGIGKKESKAVQRYGEGMYQDAYGEQHAYTEEMLKKDFPDTWQSIKKAARITREIYDGYIDELNRMLETVYPDVIDHAESNAASLQKRIDLAGTQVKNQRDLIQSIRDQIDATKKKLGSKKRADTQAYASLQSSLAYQQQRLVNAEALLATYEQRVAVRTAQKAAIEQAIASGEVLKNRRVQHRADYFHHFKEMEQGFGGLANILHTNTEIDPAIAGRSDQTKPKSRWAGFMQRRNGGAYTEDAVQGMLRYMTLAEYKLAFDPLVAHYRETAKVVRAASAELGAKDANPFDTWLDRWTNNIAGKSSDFDRIIMDAIGTRKVVGALKWFNSRVVANALLMNARSAIVQISNIPNATMYVKNPADWISGARCYAEMLFGKEKQSMREIFGMSNFMSQRLLEVGTLDESILKKPKQLAAKLLSLGDEASSTLMWWSAYQQYTRNPNAANGMYRQYDSAIDYADDITRRSVAGRGVGEMPLALTSQTVQLFQPFQVEILNTFNNLCDQVGRKNALGLLAFELSTFAINTVMKAVVGDRVLGFDFISVIIDAITHAADDDDDEEEKGLPYAVTRTLGEIASGLPFASTIARSVIPDESDRKKLFGEEDPTRYGTGTISMTAISDFVGAIGKVVGGKPIDPFDLADAVCAIALPWGGRQLTRTARAVDTLARGYGSKIDAEGDRRIQFAADDATFLEKARAVMFGKWTLPEAQAYLDDPSMLSAEDSQIYMVAVKAGVSGEHFFELRKQMREFEPIKDDDGKTTETKNVQRARLLLEDTELTDLQKALLVKPLVSADVAERADIAIMGGATANEFLRFYVDEKEINASDSESKMVDRVNRMLSYGLSDEKSVALLRSIGSTESFAKKAQIAVDGGAKASDFMRLYVESDALVEKENQYGRKLDRPQQRVEMLLGYGLSDDATIAVLAAFEEDAETAYKWATAARSAGEDVGEALRMYAMGASETTIQKYARPLQESDGVPMETYVSYYQRNNQLVYDVYPGDGKAAKKAFIEEIGQDEKLTPEQKVALYSTVKSDSATKVTYDDKCTALNERYGISWDILWAYVSAYQIASAEKGSGNLTKKQSLAIIRSVGVPANLVNVVYKCMAGKLNAEWGLGTYGETAE